MQLCWFAICFGGLTALFIKENVVFNYKLNYSVYSGQSKGSAR